MIYIGVISEVLLYLCTSIVMGYFLVSLVQSESKPNIVVPKQLIVLSILGIALFSFYPVFHLILLLGKDYNLLVTMQTVLFSFEVGKGWLLICFISIVFFIYTVVIDVKKEHAYIVIGLLFTLFLIGAQGWSSHASSLSTKGFFIHTLHLIAVSTWVGVLLIVSWFSRGKENWSHFLKWFSPLAILCFITVLSSGFFLMKQVVEPSDYTASWALSYGQALLIKHLFIIPLVAYTCINGVLIRKKVKEEGFNPIPWSKVESIVLLFIFSATAILGQQSPPHSISQTLKTEGPSTLFELWYSIPISEPFIGSLHFGVYSIFLLLISLLFLSLILISFWKKLQPPITILFSVICVGTTYLSFMLSLQ